MTDARKSQALAATFAFICGYTDWISYTRYRCFIVVQTGNLIMLGGSLTGKHSAANPGYFYIALIASFFAGCIVYRGVGACYEHRAGIYTGLFFAAFTMLSELTLFFTDRDFFDLTRERDHPLRQWTSVPYSFLYGIVASATTSGKFGTIVVMVTGHIVNAAAGIVNLFKGSPSQGQKDKLIMNCAVILFTALGVVSAAEILHSGMFDSRFPLMWATCPVIAALLVLVDHKDKPVKVLKRITDSSTSGSSSSDDGSIA